jgi:acetyl esterase/lipase
LQSAKANITHIEFTLLLSFFFAGVFANASQSSFEIIEDVPYTSSGHSRHKLDLFLPRNRKNTNELTLVVWIHGGGWQSGDKQTARNPHRLPIILKTKRYIGASICYRLSKEAKWPFQIYDCKAAIRWLRGNAEKYNIDPLKIAVWGSSAGGHLASMLGVTPDQKKLEGDLGSFQNISSRVQAVVNYYGPSAFLKMDDFPSRIIHKSPNSPESKLLGFAIHRNHLIANEASPLFHVSEKLPPFIHFHGKEDPLVPYNQSLILHEKLLSFGNMSTLITLNNGGHSMPYGYTSKFVIPFLDFHFHNIGKAPQNMTNELEEKTE